MTTSNISAIEYEKHTIVFHETDSSSIDSKGIMIFSWILWAILSQVVVVFGIFSNIIDILCFVKQGFKDSINVSLTGLAISDLGCLIPLVWTNICCTPGFSSLDLPFEVLELQYMTSGITHVMFTRISSWMTAAITVERCLCVAMPLKVKNIATPRRMFLVSTCIFVILLVSALPQYFMYKLGLKYYPDKNKTLLGIIFTETLMQYEQFSFPINSFIVPIIAFIIITVCTSILVAELKITSQWRKKYGVPTGAAKLTNSHKKVAKMVLMISSLFICCFIPVCIIMVALVAVPGFTIGGAYKELVIVFGGTGVFLESINSSVNIFIYYHSSSKFRDVFQQMFMKWKNNGRNL